MEPSCPRSQVRFWLSAELLNGHRIWPLVVPIQAFFRRIVYYIDLGQGTSPLLPDKNTRKMEVVNPAGEAEQGLVAGLGFVSDT